MIQRPDVGVARRPDVGVARRPLLAARFVPHNDRFALASKRRIDPRLAQLQNRSETRRPGAFELRDPIPFDHVAELLDDVEPSRQKAALHSAWREYASSAARPYAWSTFAKYSRERFAADGKWVNQPAEEKLTPWQDGARASSRVLVLGPYAALRVRGGALEIEHGPRADRATIRIDVDARTKPEAILFDSHGEFLTGEAIRFCARYSIALLLPGGPGRLITMIETEAEARDAISASKRDIEPSIILAQCAAAMDAGRSIDIAREIVRAKIEAEARALMSNAEARSAVLQWSDRLRPARTLNDILVVESHAAAAYWRAFRHMGLRERKGGNLPRSWLRHPLRNRGRPAFHEGVGEAPKSGNPQHASHPINAMLNYAYVVEAGRLARALAARGLILPLGFLHKPKRGRNSLVWDTIEPLRPRIDARVFEFVAEHEFARSDFPQAGLNVFRLSRDVTSALLDEVMLPRAAIEGAAEWIVELIERDEPRAGLRRATSRRVTAGGLATLPDTSGGLALGE